MQIYFGVPFASVAIFFGLYLGLVNNPGTFSRFVRFNAQQAILLARAPPAPLRTARRRPGCSGQPR